MWQLGLLGFGILLAAYAIGSLPSGYLAGRWLRGIDIREVGSGSTGATNVLRVLGKKPALAVLLADIAKGAIAVLLAGAIARTGAGSESLAAWSEVLAGLAAVVGHSKPLWLNFRGGKSVAASLGVLLALSWPVALGTIAVFAGVLALSRIVSLSSIAGAIAVSGLMVLTGEPLPYVLFGLAAGIYVIWRHRSNIQRLMEGVEPRLGDRAETSPSS